MKINLIKPIITIELLDVLPEGSIFAIGITTDNKDGFNMSDSGREIGWIAKKGDGGNDWAVYTHFTNHDLFFIQTQGDKVHPREYIENVLQFDDAVWERYRQ